MRRWGIVVVVGALCGLAAAQVHVAKEKPGMKSDPVPRSQGDKPAPVLLPGDEKEPDRPKAEARPKSDEESSSRDTIIDLKPPRGDSKRPVRDDDPYADTGVNEMKPWNPHRAAKNVEVGEYYLKQKNYRAAISRFREALEFKPRDAVATFRLGQALERAGESSEAAQRYEEYLAILKEGPFAEEARKGVERLKGSR